MICPRCGVPTTSAGVIAVGDQRVAVFQCDRCIVSTEILGCPCEASLTFYIDPASGRAVDATTRKLVDPTRN
jgi:hypothetical protein